MPQKNHFWFLKETWTDLYKAHYLTYLKTYFLETFKNFNM